MSGATSPQELIERALSAATADGCVVIANDTATTNLRWANNTLTTNGATQTVELTVISTVKGADGIQSAAATRNVVDVDGVLALVAEALDESAEA